jgi:hypothetical protein
MSSPEIEVFSLIRSKYLNTLAQNTFNDMDMDRNSIATQQAARAMLDVILQGTALCHRHKAIQKLTMLVLTQMETL